MKEADSLPPGNFSRKLAAILFTDMVGYTAVMQHDEMKAIVMQKRHQSVVDQYVKEYGGEVKNDMGDGSMSILPSAYQVIKCAMAIQHELQHGEPQVNIRVGIHIADILLEESGKVHGDGINIASRIETLGVAGAILFSKEIYNKIKNHPEFIIKKVGSYPFKNVDEPMEIFGIANEGYNLPTEAQALSAGKLKKGTVSTAEKKYSKAWLLLVIPTIIAFYLLKNNNSGDLKQQESILLNIGDTFSDFKIWKGRVIYRIIDSTKIIPASNISVDIEGTKDTTDLNGEFEIKLSKEYNNKIIRLLLNKGKPNAIDAEIRLEEEKLKALPINPLEK
jgi:class 3 adenylate cyclase